MMLYADIRPGLIETRDYGKQNIDSKCAQTFYKMTFEEEMLEVLSIFRCLAKLAASLVTTFGKI